MIYFIYQSVTRSEGHTWALLGLTVVCTQTCSNLTFHWEWTGALTNLERG